MAKIELGRIGAVVNPDGDGRFVATAAELEGMGYETVWLTGGPLEDLDQVAAAVEGTTAVRIATGILSVDRFPVDDVATLYTDLEARFPGRFVLGLGGAHGPRPFATLSAYLDRLDAVPVPASARLLAALGPRMLGLAAERSSGAFPVLVTPEYTADARARLGDGTTLAVDQLVAVEPDVERARAIARGPLGFLGNVPQYQASFRRLGFTDDEIATRADRLVDALIPGGDADAVARGVTAQLDAGADHVAVGSLGDELAGWRALAGPLGLTRR
jgi:probable F420-dependent oxidoreductase